MYLVRYYDSRSNSIKWGFNVPATDGVVILLAWKLPYVLDVCVKLLQRLDCAFVSDEALVEFYQNMAVMTKSGIPLLEAMEDYAGTLKDKRMRRIINKLISLVENGSSLSDAMKVVDIFPEEHSYIVKVGEETGNLDRIFVDLSKHMVRKIEMKGAVKRALIYPILVTIVMVFALGIWLFYIMPKMSHAFQQMHMRLPSITKFLFNLSIYLRAHGQSILEVFVCLILGLVIAFKYIPFAQKAFDKLKLYIPIVKTYVELSNTAFIAEYLSLLIHAGVNIDTALVRVGDVVGNSVYANAIRSAVKRVQSGSSLYSALESTKVFPGLFTRMVKAGEKSGNLVEQLSFVSDEYFRRLSNFVAKLDKTIEPVMLIVLGGLMGTMMYILLYPLYTSLSKIAHAGMRGM